MKNIGILTLPFGENYGCVLQAYALCTYFKKKGANPVLLRRGWNQQKKDSFIYKFKRYIYYNIIAYPIYKFYKRIPQTSLVRSSSELSNLIISYHLDSVVVGSDQVWAIQNTRGANMDFFLCLDGLPANVTLYSYAASFGSDKWKGTDDETIKAKQSITRFSDVSVRELSGKQLCSSLFEIEAKVVLDPTLLLTKNDYITTKQLSVVSYKPSNTLVSYLLDESREKIELCNELSAQKHLIVKHLFRKYLGRHISVEDWLINIAKADFVVTDSFHGMIFSIIFERQFIVIPNIKRGETRFISLLSLLGLQNRLIYNLNQDLSKLPFIDYSVVNKQLNILREDSYNFLNKLV